MDGHVCDRCGFVAEGLFAPAVFSRHLDEHKLRDEFATWRAEMTDDDHVFLRVQGILWDAKEE
jgi:hypothetical protein